MAEIKRKHSRQRDAIKAFLAARCDHPTADEIYHGLRAEEPKLSLGTVYRNLALLADQGEICRITAGDGREHFDGNAAPHDHFICRICGAIIDIPESEHSENETFEIPGFSGLITGRSVIYHGFCEKCREKLS